MKAALISNLATRDFKTNHERMMELAGQAVAMGAKLVIFPEAAATGLCNTGNPIKDHLVAETVPGPRNTSWHVFARLHQVYFAAGLLERDGVRIYDTGLLYDPQGNLILRYRRNHPGWHAPNDDPSIYREGWNIPVAETAFGTVGMLICGDLWDEKIVKRFRQKKADYLLFLMVRSLKIPRGSDVATTWLARELTSYRTRWAKTGSKTLAVNLFEGDEKEVSIGGAWHVNEKGKLLATLPLGREGILMVEL